MARYLRRSTAVALTSSELAAGSSASARRDAASLHERVPLPEKAQDFLVATRAFKKPIKPPALLFEQAMQDAIRIN